MKIVLNTDKSYELSELAKATSNDATDLLYVVKQVDGKDVSFAITRDQFIQGISGGVGPSAPFEESFVATAGQTNFTLANTTSAAWVWVNGAAQDASEWSISGDDIVLATASTVGDTVEIYYLTEASVVSGVQFPIENVTVNSELGDSKYYRIKSGTAFTLPAASTKFNSANTYTIKVKNVSGATITITADGADQIYTQEPTPLVSSFQLSDGEMVSLIAAESTIWDII